MRDNRGYIRGDMKLANKTRINEAFDLSCDDLCDVHSAVYLETRMIRAHFYPRQKRLTYLPKGKRKQFTSCPLYKVLLELNACCDRLGDVDFRRLFSIVLKCLAKHQP
jgi:hypothetical protein